MAYHRAAISVLCAGVVLTWLATEAQGQLPKPHYPITACKGAFLAFPPSVTASTPIRTFAAAKEACAEVYSDLPNADHFPCLDSFIKMIKKDPMHALRGIVSPMNGPWVYLPGHTQVYRYIDELGNTRGVASETTDVADNRVICVGTPEFPNLGGGDLVFRDTTSCPGMSLQFPASTVPNSNIPSMEVAQQKCESEGLRVPTRMALECLKAFMNHIRSDSRFVNFATDKVGPWIHMVDESIAYRWMDRRGNTKGYTDNEARHDNNHVICLQTTPFQDFGGGDFVFRDAVNCPGNFLAFPNKMSPNKDMPTLWDAESACDDDNLVLPDMKTHRCLKAFVKHVKGDPQLKYFATKFNGPWIRLHNYTLAENRWMDEDGNTRGYESSATWHGNNHVVCVGKLPATTGSSSASAPVAGIVCGALAAVALVAVGVFYREKLSERLSAILANLRKESEEEEPDTEGGTGRRGVRHSTTSQTDLIAAQESFHGNISKENDNWPARPPGRQPPPAPKRYYA